MPRRMRLNWFSPLPPSQSGIAEYSMHVLAALARRAEIAVWTDQATWPPEIDRLAEVHRFETWPDWTRLNRADATFYNIGNNAAFHAKIWEISRRHAGVVILHDTHLQHLFLELFKRQLKQLPAYRARMGRFYGRAGLEAVDELLQGRIDTAQLAARFPLTELALENALGAVVHLAPAVEPLARSSRRPVACAPLPYAADPAAEQQTPRPAGRAPATPPFRLIVLGYLGPNRRLDQILQALQTLPERDQFHLDVYGKLPGPEAWQRRLRKRKLDSLVTLHGFVSDQQLDAALDRANLAINLRYPTMGEASWTQLRLWSHGLPSLVTQTGWYATLPADAVVWVRPRHELADIRRHLQDFLAAPATFARRGAAGWRTLREVHTPENYADTLLSVAAEAGAFRGRTNAIRLVERTGALLSDFATNDEHGRLLYRVVEEIRRMAA